MGLTSSLQLGRSGLLTSQAALQVTGHNLANVGTKGYHRQTVELTPAGSDRVDQNAFIGRGVQLQAITRQVNEALEARVRTAIGDEAHSLTKYDLLSQVESLQNELSDADLSTQLGAFFNAWSQLSNNPQDLAARSLVVQEGKNLASFAQSLRGDLVDMRSQIDKSSKQAVNEVNNLLTQIEELNGRIMVSSGRASSGAAGLKDQRDALLAELGGYLDISTVVSPNGVADVFVGSLPIVLNGQSRGIELQEQTVDGEVQINLVLADDKSPLDLTGGKLSALVDFRKNEMGQAIDTLDGFVNELIWQVNKVHTGGQGLVGMGEVTGTTEVSDPTLALNDPDLDLGFTPEHGSFKVHVTQKSTGQRITSTINVDLDGINPATDTTLNSLVAGIDGVANIGATVSADGRVRITADASDFEISFSEDTSGALAALGVNTFFSGKDATDVAVNATVAGNPKLLAASGNHQPGDNTNALAMAALKDQPIQSLNGFSLKGYWADHVEQLAIKTAQAKVDVEANAVVRENLEEQQQQVSGVNPDEEAINLLQFQRAYQASARFISTVDELFATLINMV